MIIGAVVTLVGAAIAMLWAPETRNRTFAEFASLAQRWTKPVVQHEN
jgi:hypothetical protein